MLKLKHTYKPKAATSGLDRVTISSGYPCFVGEGGLQNVESCKICCGFLRAEFRYSDRRQYSEISWSHFANDHSGAPRLSSRAGPQVSIRVVHDRSLYLACPDVLSKVGETGYGWGSSNRI